MAEQINIQISTENDAFVDTPATEIARILRELADEFEQDGGPCGDVLQDSNGNTCGCVFVTVLE